MFGTLSKILPNSISRTLIATYYKSQLIFAKGKHSSQEFIEMPGMSVQILPALSDNYMYLIIDNDTKEAAAVDPVDPDTLFSAVKNLDVNLTKVLTTHHHWDHAGGNKKVKELMKDIPIFGGDKRVDAVTDIVKEGQKIKIGSLVAECLETPCHTTGHICFVVGPPGSPEAVFTGDTLFIGGCGKFFEGDAKMMCEALIGKLSALPDETKVYCGHEYTVQNLKFAKLIEPNNSALSKKLEWAVQTRSANKPTVPSTIGEEKSYNPFMRVADENIQSSLGRSEAIGTMKDIRKKKDDTSPKVYM
ncbi:hydroxyacylglutathione hydrolase, mitochondrial isoform X1 [Halyomorpha halys]|uniref:hydroxyacylglutathione hydrolase, mitochondrial isoform X1 n=2 Tax=Halyomorpha halys TaxID=286706 RepID=UPI0006D51E62|nr:hydroxyacylglutathione hydrolase, mitochondrial isoform X1 [Halyomorpha halys]